jgi:polysaccharide pyruvyl transferase WcaK-like protein
MARRVLLLGFFGAPNFGDELIGRTAAKALLDLGFGVTIGTRSAAVSKQFMDDLGDRAEFREVNFNLFRPGNYLGLIRLFKQHDLILHAGGGVLQDVHSFRLLTQSALSGIFSTFAGRNMAGIGIGVGPISSKYGEMLARSFIRSSARLAVRDKASLQAARALYSESGALSLGVDTAFTASSGRGLPGSRTVALVFRSWPGLNVDGIARLVEGVRKKGKAPAFFVCEPRVDVDFYKKVNARLERPAPVVDPKNIGEGVAYIEALDSLISMRLHPLVVALKAGKPVIAVNYDDKVSEMMRGAGMDGCVFGLDFDPEAVLAKLDSPCAPLSRPEMEKKSENARSMVAEAVKFAEPRHYGLGEKTRSLVSFGRIVLQRAGAKLK